MLTTIAGIVVLGSILYCVTILLSYNDTSSGLTQTIENLHQNLLQEKQRLNDSELKIEMLQEDTPQRQRLCDRLQRWISLLSAQRARVETDLARRANTSEQAILDNIQEIRPH